MVAGKAKDAALAQKQTLPSLDRKLVMVVARSVSGLPPADWKALPVDKQRSYRLVATRILRAIAAYQRRAGARSSSA
jgi:hypothetical protein